MQVAIVTVGDELLAGDIVDTNGSWLAQQLTERGCRVREIASLPDCRSRIADRIGELVEDVDKVIVTGGVGGTPDDVTMDAIAASFDVPLDVQDTVRADIVRTLEQRDREYGDFDVESWAATPAGSRPIVNDDGLSPGCVIDDVYVLPGVPVEMKGMFEQVADEFSGDHHVRAARSERSESELVSLLDSLDDRFDVAVGCYPNKETGEKRIVVRGGDVAAVEAAHQWLSERISVGDGD